MIKQDRLVKTFLDLVKIDSPSGEEKEVTEYVVKRLEKLGAKVEFDNYGNVIGKIKGKARYQTVLGKGEPLMLNAHLDTVEPGRSIKPIVDGDIIKSDGTTILGGDPKAGVSIILEALTSVIEDDKKHVPLEIVFTLNEEIGLLGARNLNYKKISAKRGITFDGEEETHNITISAPGYNRVDATITGKGAHAGVEPEKGISAIKIASEIISSLKIGRIDFETTANIGLISGGTARNAVAEKSHFKGEIRSRNVEKLEKHTAHFKDVFNKIMKKYPKAKVKVDIKREYDPYLFEENHRVVKHISTALTKMKIKPNLQHSGGGSDVNIFHTHGIESIVVGTGVYEAHTTREYVVISQMYDAARFCERIVLTNLGESIFS